MTQRQLDLKPFAIGSVFNIGHALGRKHEEAAKI